MRELLLFTAVLLCAASMWAATPEQEGPWTLQDMRTGTSGRDELPSTSFNELNNRHFGTLEFWNDDDGISWSVVGSSDAQSKSGVFSIYYLNQDVPSYTRKRMTWTFKLGSKSKKHYSNTCLYALQGKMEDIYALTVDFTETYTNPNPAQDYLLAQYRNTSQNGDAKFTDAYTKTFDFDNRSGSTSTTKSCYLLLTHVVSSADSKSDIKEWGSFLSQSGGNWTTFYYKHVTFDANGGEGTMDVQTIENSGNLRESQFSRTYYNFAGWSTSPDGEVAYADKASVSASASDKGPVTLYAQWTRDPLSAIILIGLIGEVNYTDSCKAKIDEARAAYDALSDEQKEGIPLVYNTLVTAETAYYTIDAVVKKIDAIGTVEYTAESKALIDDARAAYDALTEHQDWVPNYTTLTDAEDAYAALSAKAKIEAIGVVEYTPECKALIDAARDAYDALTDEQKAWLTAADVELLTTAEDAYALLDGNTTIRFVDSNEDPIRSQLIALDYPTPPVIEGFTFQYWQPVAEDISAGTIRLQAIYKSNVPTAIDDANANAKAKAAKLIRNGNLYILTEKFIYTINGQKAK